MKKLMNFTLTHDDIERFSSAEELRSFLDFYGLDGVELMPLTDRFDGYGKEIVTDEEIIGVHLKCISDWMALDRTFLLEHYRRELDFAEAVGAKYVVFHVSQVDDEETMTYRLKHTDEEVIAAVLPLLNELLDGQDYHFEFLMENLWWPGLNFLRPELTEKLLDGVHYEKKGLLLDTGHFLHTNLDLASQEEGISYLIEMLKQHEKLLPFFKGMHLQQSLTGEYVKNLIQNPPVLSEDPQERFRQTFEHVFCVDRHEPFTTPEVRRLAELVNPDFLTFEYITETREQLEQYLAITYNIFSMPTF